MNGDHAGVDHEVSQWDYRQLLILLDMVPVYLFYVFKTVGAICLAFICFFCVYREAGAVLMPLGRWTVKPLNSTI